MECPHCAAANSLMSDRCLQCGGDLSTPPRQPPSAAKSATDEVADLMERVGLPWLARITDHAAR